MRKGQGCLEGFTWLSMENVIADSLPFGVTELTQVSTAKIHLDAVDLFNLVIGEEARL